MASYGPDDSEDAVKVYTTDTIVDHPGAKIVYKGLVTIGKRETYPTFMTIPHLQMRCVEASSRVLEILADIALLTEEAKERAKKLGANAIVGMKITDSKNGGYTFVGTAVRYST